MRPLLPPDLDLLTRVMLGLPAELRAGALASLLSRADAADRYRKRTGRLHPQHGDGSLLSLALRCNPVGHQRLCDPAYFAALSGVLTTIIAWRGRHQTHQHF